MVSVGDCANALALARALHDEVRSPGVAFNCAAIMVDAAERLDDEPAVRKARDIFETLHADPGARQQLGDDLLYNLANAKSSLIHMKSRRSAAPDYRMRAWGDEEEVVRLYYEGSDRLRAGTPEFTINCASTLRVQGRLYEAIDLLDFVLSQHPDHPNAHLKLGEMLWAVGMVCRARDGAPKSLFVAALWHLREANRLFVARDEPVFAESTASSAEHLADVIGIVLGLDAEDALSEMGTSRLGVGARLGVPLGLTLLARSPYRDEDDPMLLDHLPGTVHEFFVDAVGTYALGRALLKGAASLPVSLPRWGARTPSSVDHAIYASVRQFWSVLEKVGWIVNAHFKLDLAEEECSFARAFAPPSKSVRKRLGIKSETEKVDRHPNLEGQNPGLLALSGISTALRTGVYDPVKRLRHGAEHRSPGPVATADDAGVMLGIARAALLHAADAVLCEGFRQVDDASPSDPVQSSANRRQTL